MSSRSRLSWLRSWAARALTAVRRSLSADGLAGLFLLGMLMTVAWSVERAGWAATPPLYAMIALGFAMACALARVKRTGWALFPAGLVAGLAVTFVLVSARAGAGGAAGMLEAMQRFFLWGRAAGNGGMSADQLPFVLLLSLLSWFVAYSATWSVFRSRGYWWPVILSGTALIINMSLVKPAHVIEFAIFMGCALLLRIGMEAGGVRPRGARPRGLAMGIGSGAVLTAAIIGAAFIIPTGSFLGEFDGLYNLMHHPVERVSDDFNRLFAGVGGNMPSSYRYFGQEMALGGSVRLSDAGVLLVESPSPSYLRAQTYDTYTANGWKTGNTEAHDIGWSPDAPGSVESKLSAQSGVSVTVTPLVPADQRFVPGSVESISQPSQERVYANPTYAIDILDASKDAQLPASLQPVAAAVRAAVRSISSRQAVTVTDVQKVVPSDVIVQYVTVQRGRAATVQLMRKEPAPPDQASYTSGKAGTSPYTVNALVSQATPAQLQAAGSQYPGWVADRYLGLPDTLPSRVKALADQITAGKTTPYDRAMAIEAYLKANYPYTLAIDPPPYNSDAVDYFLFTLKKGYCDYFSSAMAVMLRAEGIPSRVVSGYTPGERQADGKWLVRDRDAHSWTEAFFPGYGWIDFEPTPGNTIPGSPAVAAPATPTPEPTDTPAATSPEPTETPAAAVETSPLVPPPGGTVPLALLCLLLVPATLGLALAIGWRWFAGKPQTPRAAYVKLQLAGRLAGVRPDPSETPVEYALRLQERWPDVGGPARVIAESYTEKTYANPDRGGIAAFGDAWASLVATVRRRTTRGNRGRILRFAQNDKESPD